MVQANILERSIDLLADLVGFDTTSYLSNLTLIEYVEAYCQTHGAWHERIDEADGKASLIIRIGEAAPGGYVFSGHSDVVPVGGQDWQTKPFEQVRKDGKLFGRGTTDMKGFLAVCLAMLPEWQSRALKEPIYIVISHDEEVGCLGAAPLALWLKENKVQSRCIVIGEPTEMQVIGGHKGIKSFTTEVYGLSAHASLPGHGVNALIYAAKIIQQIEQMAVDVQSQNITGKELFDPPYTTFNVGCVSGGKMRNVIPEYVAIEWEFRPIPGANVDAIMDQFHAFCRSLEEQMKQQHSEAMIKTSMSSQIPSCELRPNEDYLNDILTAANRNSVGAVSFGTEAGVFQSVGFPVVICGPGSIDQAHIANEFIEESQLDKCITFLSTLTSSLEKD